MKDGAPESPAASLKELLDGCDREPIQIPGAIQPHGYLLALSEPELRIVQLSGNTGELGRGSAATLLGRPLSDLLEAPSHARLTRAIDTGGLTDSPLYLGHLRIDQRLFDGVVHRYDGVLILELEPTDQSEENSFASMYPLVRSFVASLQQTESLQGLCELAARETRAITGFGRVLVYKFNEQGHGHVLAEDLETGYDSYLDLHFPASDIPRQARELYRTHHIRLISDANYQPSPLLPQLHPTTGRPTDLRYAALRSVSPVHAQYLRNMRTLASMSISIIVRGQLWGLISCHHHGARTVAFDVRTACEHLGQILSLQIEAKEDRSEAAHGLDLRRKMVALLSQMADSDNFVDGLAASPGSFLDFADATGAAIIAGGRCLRIGAAPDEPELLAFADWLSRQDLHNGVYHSNTLSKDYAQATSFRHAPAGVLAASISELHQDFLIWFRPEVVRTVRWAGNPEKQAGEVAGDGSTHLLPRSSFESWAQTVSGQSLPWRPSELDGAIEFRNAILAVVLRRAEELAALSGELERSNRELEAFSYSVSHDLRAPLRHIVGYADLLREFEGQQLSDRGNRFLHNIEESAHFAGTLVDDLLTFSQMGRSALRITAVPLRALVERAIVDLHIETEGRSIDWRVGDLPTVQGDPSFLMLVFRNLLSNAIKYSRGRSPQVIEISAEDRTDSQVVHVRDNGIGFSMQYVSKLFGVFQRLHRMEDFEGTGIGLANVRRIIERHDGHVWAEGEPDKGARFSFSLPKVPRAADPKKAGKARAALSTHTRSA